MAIRAVLFDFGGVIADEGFSDGLKAAATEQGLDVDAILSAATQAVYDSGFVLGKGTEAQFWQLLRLRTGMAIEDAVLSERILQGFVIRPWMIELVRRLRSQGFITGILSDQTHWLELLDEQYHFAIEFEQIYNSYYLGKGKRDPSLFTDVAEDLGLSPSEILFIDDNEAHVQRAYEAGMSAIWYKNQEDFIAKLCSTISIIV